MDAAIAGVRAMERGAKELILEKLIIRGIRFIEYIAKNRRHVIRDGRIIISHPILEIDENAMIERSLVCPIPEVPPIKILSRPMEGRIE